MPVAFVEEMRAVGVPVDSPWDLVNVRSSYKAAIPVLVDWLQRSESDAKFREGLVRALTVKQARGAAGSVLLEEFRRADATPDYRWAVGNALEVVAVDDDFDELVALAVDRRYGRDRQMIVLALGRSSDSRAVDVLIELLDDDDVAGHAAMALGRLRAPAAREALERRSQDANPWVRREAKKALAKISG